MIADARWHVPSVPEADDRLKAYRNRLRQLGAAEEHDLRVAAGKTYRARMYAIEQAATDEGVDPGYVHGC